MPQTSELVHTSPAAIILPNESGPVISVARRIRSESMTRTNRSLGAIDIKLGSTALSDEPPLHQELREAVDATLPASAEEERIIRFRLVTNAKVISASRKRSPGLPNYNLHTDFWVNKKRPVVTFERRDFGRKAITIDGVATRATSGVLRAPNAHEFTANLFSRTSPEQQMIGHATALFGADGQLIRGPVGDSELLALGGKTVETTMPTGVWYELHPDTAHEMPPELEDGRIIVSIDRAA